MLSGSMAMVDPKLLCCSLGMASYFLVAISGQDEAGSAVRSKIQMVLSPARPLPTVMVSL